MNEEIRALLPEARPSKLFRYQCLGRGEADIGETTEKALEGSHLLTGYRVHRPYVEVKVWCDEARLPEAKPYLDRLDRALAPWIAARGDEDLGVALVQELARYDEVEILDCVTGGMLARRLGDALAARNLVHAGAEAPNDRIHLVSDWSSPADPREWVESALEAADADPETLTLAAAGFGPDGSWTVGMSAGSKTRVETLRLPFHSQGSNPRTERNRAYVTEMLLKHWSEWLRSGVN
jgi:hypothetical protein